MNDEDIVQTQDPVIELPPDIEFQPDPEPTAPPMEVISVDESGFLHLLPPGEEIARRIYGRHQLLTRFLLRLGVSGEVAAADACKIEHNLSDQTFAKLKEYIEKHAH